MAVSNYVDLLRNPYPLDLYPGVGHLTRKFVDQVIEEANEVQEQEDGK